MDKVIVNAESFTSIADAIREATKTSDIMRPAEMPEKIKSIMPGGIEFGEYIPTSNVSTFKAEHHLGEIPYMVVIWKADEASVANSARIVFTANGAIEYSEEAGRRISSCSFARGIKDNGQYYVAAIVNVDEGDDGYGDTDTHFFAPSSSSVTYYAGVKYKWMAVGF